MPRNDRDECVLAQFTFAPFLKPFPRSQFRANFLILSGNQVGAVPRYRCNLSVKFGGEL
jgi:hypothetical protein